MVILKLAVVLFVIVRRRVLRQSRQLEAVRPLGLPRASTSSAYTVRGRPTPAGSRSACSPGRRIIFFAYIGFDSVSTHAEEAQEPPARRADRHHRLADPLHGPLHRRGRGADRDGPLRPDQHRRPGLRRLRRRSA